ncbi:MAG: AsmA-like C-terminal region-containing protein [Bacteroidales bacterium]
MKKFLKILFGIIVIIIVLMLILPIVFKGKILETVKTEVEKNVEAHVDFKDVSFSFFRDFPSLSMKVDDISVVGKDQFEGDTLASIPSIYVSFNLGSVFGSKGYEINNVTIVQPYAQLIVNKEGESNWDIAKASAQEPDTTEDISTKSASTEEEKSSSSIKILLDNFQIDKARVKYVDNPGEMSFGVEGFDFKLRGDLSAERTTIKLSVLAKALSYKMGNIAYLNKANLDFDAAIDADLKNHIFTFKKNTLAINDLKLFFEGAVSMLPNDEINTVLTFRTSNTEFKQVLSMVPAVYSKDFEKLKTSGNFLLDGSLNGIYKENHYPAFTLNLEVKDGMFQYPDLPGAITNVNILTKVQNPGGDLDLTVVDVSKFGLQMSGNPFSASMRLSHPISDPNIQAKLNGTVDLDKVRDVIPLDENQKINGKIKLDVDVNGKLSSIEKEEYEDFIAIGSVLVQGFSYKSEQIPPVNIEVAQLNFAPKYLDLVSFKSTIGTGDFSANGKIENYLAYVLKDEVIKARLTTKSKFINLNEFMTDEKEVVEDIKDESADTTNVNPEPAQQTTPKADTTAKISVFKVPENIDFVLNSTFDKLKYDELDLTNVRGVITIKDGAVNLKPLKADLLGGQIIMKGDYITKDIPNAKVALDLEANNFDIQKTYSSFKAFRELAPSAKHINGTVSLKTTFNSDLNKEMSPVLPSVQGYGNLKTSAMQIKGLPALDKIADAIKNDKLKNLKLDPTDLSFKIEDGKVITTPFKIKSGNMNATVQGYTALSKEIKYNVDFVFPRKDLGGDANKALGGIVDLANSLGANFSLGDNVNVATIITGTVDKPVVKVDFQKSLSGGSSGGGSVKDQVKDQVKKSVNQELLKQADNIEAEAAKMATQLVAKAKETAENAKQEAQKQAQKLIDEGAKNGWLGKKAGEKAAEAAKKKAEDLANQGIKAAEDQAARIKAEAKQKADALREKANS